MEFNSLNKFGHVEQYESRLRKANNTGAEEKLSWGKVVLNVFTEVFRVSEK